MIDAAIDDPADATDATEACDIALALRGICAGPEILCLRQRSAQAD